MTTKIAVVATNQGGAESTLHVLGNLRDARIVINSLRYRETYCTEGNGYTGRTYRLMRGTSAQDWKQVR